MTKEPTKYCCCGYVITLLLRVLLVSTTSTVAFSPMTAGLTNTRHRLPPIKCEHRSKGILQMTTTSGGIADIEEITNFADENGIVLSFTTFGPGYRGVATSKNDPENILGYIEGFIRPGGKILHADKMEIFKSALSSARREEASFKGGGTFLGPGLLIAFVCLLHGKENGCQTCEFLAIDDAEFQHKRLVRYYKTAGFDEVRYVGEELKDIPDRLVWGGCGTLMTEKIDKILTKWTRIIRGSDGKGN
ncbi:hypothetical protein HJC23_001051 [Cyclotella cryptica]|uniref:N-acetyltransferase domain-containing protein n=1 Tax=Cyclotella cryptica TaxID=29204 RepID=A0ABD3QQH9_9STRA|eukprot:CCRYP_005001-RA/>CCRYP_005001-RA protein AED:0.03 eAED:0.03 QI:109/1/1/1/1/1/2/192/246